MDNNFSWGLEVDYIAHYGVPHGHGPNGGSGRYPWGSGAKWGKTPLGRGIDRVKGFFKKKKPATSNVETSEAKREVNISDKTEITTASQNQPDHEAQRKAALESGDRNEIAKYFNESSYPELQQALNKANLKDQLNKSINDFKSVEPKIKTPEENRADYVKQELWSGDLNRIMAIASDKSVSSQDLTNAITKANTMSAANAKLNPSKAQQAAEKLEKVRNALDTGVKLYESGAQAWNTGASLYNLFGNPSKPLTKLPTDVKSFDPVKYAADQEKKSKEAEEKAKKAREAYVNQELWSGDLNRILAIAGDAKISNKEMEGAIAKAKQIEKLKNPSSNSEKKESKPESQKEVKEKSQPQKELKEKTKSVIELVSKKKLTDYEDYSFPNDDNYSPKQAKKTDDLGDYYKYLTSQEIPKWMYKASLDDYSDDYNFFD